MPSFKKANLRCFVAGIVSDAVLAAARVKRARTIHQVEDRTDRDCSTILPAAGLFDCALPQEDDDVLREFFDSLLPLGLGLLTLGFLGNLSRHRSSP